MKIAVITDCDAIGMYTVQRLRECWDDLDVIRPLRDVGGPDRTTSSRASALLATGRANPAYRAARSTYLRARHVLHERSISRVLYGGPTPPVPPTYLGVSRDELRHRGGPLREAPPDVLVLNGAPILRPPVLELPRVATINLHFGISPQYRGSHTVFQAMSRDDWDHVGLTLHHVDAGVDTGAILAHVYPSLTPSDTEATIMAKCVRLGTETLLDALREGAVASGRPQSEPGTLYRARDRHPAAEARQFVRRRLLRRRPPRRPSRVVSYWREQPADLGV